MSLQNANASPSDAHAHGLYNAAREREMNFAFPGALVDEAELARHYFFRPGRILGATLFRRLKGDDGTTTVDVQLNGTSILASVASFPQASDSNLKAVPQLDTTHAAWDGTGIVVAPGDYLTIKVKSVEGGAPAGVDTSLLLLVG